MKTTLRLCVCAVVLTVLSTSFTYADDKPAKKDDTAKKPADKAKATDKAKKVENTEYKNWAQFKPGAFSTMTMTTTTPMGNAEVTVTQTLKSITPEKAVIELSMVQKMMGQERKMPPQTQEVPALVPEAEAQEKLNPPGKIAEGEETLTVCGKKLKTKWMQSKITKQGMTMTTKVWTCDEMPGQVVKLESNGEGGMAMSSTGAVVKYDTGTKGKKDAAKTEKKQAPDTDKKTDAAKKDADKAK